MVFADPLQHPVDGQVAARRIIRRQHHARKIAAPSLAGDDVHFTSDAVELRQGIGVVLGLGDARIGFHLEFAGELFRTDPPLAVGTGQEVPFEERLIVLEHRHHGGRNLLQFGEPGAFTGQLEDLGLVEIEVAMELLDGCFDIETRRVLEARAGGGDDRRNLPDAGDRIGHIGLVRQRGPGEQGKHRSADQRAVTPRIRNERLEILGEPLAATQAVGKDIVLDPSHPAEFLIVHLAGQFRQRGLGLSQPFFTRRR